MGKVLDVLCIFIFSYAIIYIPMPMWAQLVLAFVVGWNIVSLTKKVG